MTTLFTRSSSGRHFFHPSKPVLPPIPAAPPTPSPAAVPPRADVAKPAVRTADPTPPGINFATGVTVTVRMNNGDQYTGEIVTGTGGFLWLKLAVPFDGYAPGVVVHLNESLISSVG